MKKIKKLVFSFLTDLALVLGVIIIFLIIVSAYTDTNFVEVVLDFISNQLTVEHVTEIKEVH